MRPHIGAISFVVVLSIPVGIAKLKTNFYIIWTVCNVLIVPVVHFLYLETFNLSLEAIDDMFVKNNTIWAGRD